MSVALGGGGSLWLPERGNLRLSVAIAVNGIPAFGCFWQSVAVTVCGGCLLLWLRVAVATCGCLRLAMPICGCLLLAVAICRCLSTVAGSNYQWLSVACIC